MKVLGKVEIEFDDDDRLLITIIDKYGEEIDTQRVENFSQGDTVTVTFNESE